LLPVIHTPTNYDEAFSSIASGGPVAMLVSQHVSNNTNRQVIDAFAGERRIPGMYPVREYVTVGELISYGVNVPDLFRRAAGYVDKILNGP
jgi:putative ABC transport system substrate-binding protein